jgi:hypothetical protein
MRPAVLACQKTPTLGHRAVRKWITSFACAAIAGAISAPASGAVNFVDIVPDQIVTRPGSGPGLISQYDIDFNGDGSREVRVFVSTSSTTGFNVLPVAGNNIMSVPNGPFNFFAYPAFAGEAVGPTPIGSSTWSYDASPGSNLCACQATDFGISCVGFFAFGFVGFVGVEFTLPDGIHYGVIEIEGLIGNGRVRSYAWETTPNTPIIAGAPEPGRVGLFVITSLTFLMRRRRR